LKRLFACLLLAPAICLAKPTATAGAQALGVSTQIGILTDLYSYNSIYITSDAPGSTMFQWDMTLCPETQTQHCVVFHDHLSLTKGQSFKKTYTLHTAVIFQATGDKPVTAETHVWGGGAESFATHTAYAEVN
jgi:hypothetical protein